MNRNTVTSFNLAYSYEPTGEVTQLIGDLLTVWGKLEPAAAKNPALIRKGIIFGLGLAEAIQKGEIKPEPLRAKRAFKRPVATKAEPVTGE